MDLDANYLAHARDLLSLDEFGIYSKPLAASIENRRIQ
jgi:hypothetical protein